MRKIALIILLINFISSFAQTLIPAGINAYKLNSYPNSKKVIFLNFSSGTYPDQFIWDQWNMVSEDYRPFDVTVTTDIELFNNTSTENKITIQFTSGNGGGLCGYNVFGSSSSYACQSLVNDANGYFLSVTATHEIGHGLGLSHDGGNGTEYYSGNAVWSPIMGGSHGKAYATFSKGEYSGASNKEDDFDVMGYYLDLKEDVHNDVVLVPKNGQITPDLNNGVIETDGDVDSFTFESTGGNINLTVSPKAYYNNLHVEAVLKNEAGSIVLSGTPNLHNTHINFPEASIPSTLPGVDLNSKYLFLDGANSSIKQASKIEGVVSAGTYTLEITNTSLAGAYPSFGSRGYYEIEGTISNHIFQSFVDAEISDIEHQKISCTDFTPTITIKNNGPEEINAVTLRVTSGSEIEDYQINIDPLLYNEKGTVLLNAVSTIGENTPLSIQILSVNDGSMQDVDLTNNNIQSTYTLKDGIDYDITISAQDFNNNLNLQIKNSNNQLVYDLYKADFEGYIKEEKQHYSAKTCLLKDDCYQIEATDVFNPLASETCPNTEAFDISKDYLGGSKVIYNNKVYNAKYYVTGKTPAWPSRGNIPGEGVDQWSDPWELVSQCVSNFPNDSIAFKINDNTVKVKAQDYDYNNGIDLNKCTDVITSVSTATNVKNIYPNPTSNKVYLSDTYEKVIVSSLLGSIQIERENTSEIDFSNLKAGIYMIRIIENEKLIFQKKIVKID